MEKAKHSKAPFRRVGFRVASADEKVIAECMPDGVTGVSSVFVRPDSHDECISNANLFVAAPDLLAACELVMATPVDDTGKMALDDAVKIANTVSAAIEKAKGE